VLNIALHVELGLVAVAAKAWVAARKSAAPEITDAQQAFVKASHEAETARIEKERAHAKGNPGRINMASASIGSGNHIAGELFKM
jgi:hypothetical protein